MSLERKQSVWEGIFNSFEEAGGDLDAFDTDIWVAKQKERARQALEANNQGLEVSRDYPLSLVVAMLLRQKKNLSILDFGGGMGLHYLELITKVPEALEGVQYFVVDGETTIKNLPEDIAKYTNLKFFGHLDNIIEKVDIIHIGSTLHYIENWKSLLQKLSTQFTPKYFVFSDLLAGNVPIFVSHQIFYNKRIPVWMLNEEEIMRYMKDLNFHNSYRSLFQANILDNEDLPTHSLPEHNRIKKTLNLVFEESHKSDV